MYTRWNKDSKIICSKCHERPAHNKKRCLCILCYQRAYVKGEINNKTLKNKFVDQIYNYRFKAEVVFGQKHPSFIYQPATFYLDYGSYRPDFYDPQKNIFYEIIGSRQRFGILKKKIKKFRQLFPYINLEVVCGDGKPYHSTKNPEIVNFDQEVRA